MPFTKIMIEFEQRICFVFYDKFSIFFIIFAALYYQIGFLASRTNSYRNSNAGNLNKWNKIAVDTSVSHLYLIKRMDVLYKKCRYGFTKHTSKRK
jgi:hypothetical protein